MTESVRIIIFSLFHIEDQIVDQMSDIQSNFQGHEMDLSSGVSGEAPLAIVACPKCALAEMP